MLKSILNLSEVSVITKKNQSTIHGGFNDFCLELPPDCEGGILFECTCYDENGL